MPSIDYVTIMYQKLLLSLNIACAELFHQKTQSTAPAAAEQTSQCRDIRQNYLVTFLFFKHLT